MFWIEAQGPGRLATAAQPRAYGGLEDQIQRWQVASVDLVVSLLEPHEVHQLGLAAERDACHRAGLAFLSFPIPDGGVPASLAKTRGLVATCKDRFAAGEGVIVHCRAGIGRSSTIAACVLIALGYGPNEAIERITTARGLRVPDTPAQAEWVAGFTPA